MADSDARTDERAGSASTDLWALARDPDRGRWASWSADRRSELWSAGVLAGSGTVIDLTGDEPQVIRAPSRPTGISDRIVGVAALAIVVLNLLDIVTTRLAIAQGGAEGNPLAGLFVDNLTLFVAVKVFVPGLVAWRMWSIRSRITPLLLAAMWWVVGVYSLAITVNALHLL